MYKNKQMEKCHVCWCDRCTRPKCYLSCKWAIAPPPHPPPHKWPAPWGRNLFDGRPKLAKCPITKLLLMSILHVLTCHRIVLLAAVWGLGMLGIIVSIILTSFINPKIWNTSWKLYFANFAHMWIGWSLGYLIARLLRQPHRQSRTIAFETGAQHVGLALALISFSFKDDHEFFLDIILYRWSSVPSVSSPSLPGLWLTRSTGMYCPKFKREINFLQFWSLINLFNSRFTLWYMTYTSKRVQFYWYNNGLTIFREV